MIPSFPGGNSEADPKYLENITSTSQHFGSDLLPVQSAYLLNHVDQRLVAVLKPGLPKVCLLLYLLHLLSHLKTEIFSFITVFMM